MGHIVTNFDAKTWAGIAGIVLMIIIFFKGMGTKEGGTGGTGSNSNGKSGSSGVNTSTSNTTSTTNNSNNNSVN